MSTADTPLKILFLDVDGVLNSVRTKRAFGRYPFDFSDADMACFDPVAIALIRRLCRETRCRVVLSSSWRTEFRCDEVGEAFDLPVIGATPSRGFASRGGEIYAWLHAHPEVVHYAIVDDCETMLPHQQPFYVQTDAAHGLTLDDYDRLHAILA